MARQYPTAVFQAGTAFENTDSQVSNDRNHAAKQGQGHEDCRGNAKPFTASETHNRARQHSAREAFPGFPGTHQGRQFVPA